MFFFEILIPHSGLLFRFSDSMVVNLTRIDVKTMGGKLHFGKVFCIFADLERV